MDLLKGELQRKRKETAIDFAGKCFVRRSELEQKQIRKRRDEQRRKLLAKAREPAARSPKSAAASGPDEPGGPARDPSPSSSSPAAASSVLPALYLPCHEVVRRLRDLRQPVTLFGEDDAARVERFWLVLMLVEDVDDLDMVEDQTNLNVMILMRKRRKVAAGRGTNAKGRRVGGGAGVNSEDEKDGDGDHDSNRMNANFEELCEEDKILVFFKRLLNDWKRELDAMTELEKTTAEGKHMIETFRQRSRDLNPLFGLCRKKVVPHDIRQALVVIVGCCMKHDYLEQRQSNTSSWPLAMRRGLSESPWLVSTSVLPEKRSS